jgi:hypothetical protein
MYNKRTWLNPEYSYASSYIAAFDGDILHRDKYNSLTCLTIGDCNSTITLNKNEGDTMEDFINKMKILKNDIEFFIEYLEDSVIV